MGKGGPKPPDPVRTAQAQMDMNRQAALESAKLNQINQVTPWGSLQYTGELGSPDRAQHMALHPMDQRNLMGQRAVQGGLLDILLGGGWRG